MPTSPAKLLLESAPSSTKPLDVVQSLEERANTLYDPLVVTQLEAIVKENQSRDWRETRRRVPVSDIKEGMVLAEDLITSSAVKLFSRGGVVTSGIRDIILRRHVIDPIIHGVWVQQ